MDIRFINGRTQVYTPNSNGWKDVYDVDSIDDVWYVRFLNEDGHLWAWPIDGEELSLLEEDVPLNEFDYM